jgi:peptidoglycan hydrolase CwlO-like protein
MPYCRNCGARLETSQKYCKRCGAPVLRSVQPAAQAVEESAHRRSAPSLSGKGRISWNIIAIIVVLAIGLVILGVLYGISANNLNSARADITELEANITDLQDQLALEEANVASLETQLATATEELNLSRSQATQLQADLDESELHVADLQTELEDSIANATSLQADLDEANADLASAMAANSSLTDELTSIKSPRHFTSLEELQTWLAKDDTNTNPDYASLSPAAKAYLLQVKALRDGYILSACLDWDSSYIYTWNVAIANDTIYSVNAATDVVTEGPDFADTPPSYPIPIPIS